jgi:ATP-dependent Clp protease, protease subunit
VLGTPIDDQVANLVVAQLLHLDATAPGKDIALYLNSPGGDMVALFAIYDTIQHLRSDVATVCVGQAASAAAVLLAAGTAGKRSILPNARVLIHQPHGGVQGQSTDLELAVAEVVELRRRMLEVLSLHTGQPVDKLQRDTDRDYILRGADAVAYGLVDQVLTPLRSPRAEVVAAHP